MGKKMTIMALSRALSFVNVNADEQRIAKAEGISYEWIDIYTQFNDP